MKKKLLAVSIVLAMLLQALTGCSFGRANSQPGSNSTGDELQIGVIAKGYGDQFATALAEAYEAKTGVKTVVVRTGAGGGWVGSSLSAGPEVNNVDIIFDINATLMNSVATAFVVEGYERIFADLSDIYDEVPEGYSTEQTLEEMTDPYLLRACTWDLEGEGFGNGKQYFIAYVSGIEGLLYNADLFEKYNLEVPVTTNEMFAVMDQMKALNAKNDEGLAVYPFTYSGGVDYMNMIARAWWAQYDTVEGYNRAMEGKDASGNYTAESAKSAGKLSALQHVAKILDQDAGYADPNSYSQSFTNAQVKFLDKQAFMMVTGDWVEREMEGNFGGEDMGVRFMRIPVNSDIILQCETVKSEEQLVETIAYIDGTAEKPAYLSEADEARIKEARSVYSSEGNQHLVYIPAYSNMLDEAKDFLRFMVSKEGQEIMMSNSYGNMAGIITDVAQFDAYESLSALQKSKYEMMLTGAGLTMVGKNHSHPMAYASGVSDFYSTPTMENAFGIVKSSKSYTTPLEYWTSDYEDFVATWEDKMSTAGVSN